MSESAIHNYIGEDPGYCLHASQVGVGRNSRPQFEYCEEPQGAPCHPRDIAAREVYEFVDSLKLEPLLPEIAAKLSRMAPRDVEGFLRVARELKPLLDNVRNRV